MIWVLPHAVKNIWLSNQGEIIHYSQSHMQKRKKGYWYFKSSSPKRLELELRTVIISQSQRFNTSTSRILKIKSHRHTHTKQNNETQQKKNTVPCSLRAVKTIVPVSSPTTHSAMREGRAANTDDRPPRLLTVFTGLELTTFTVSVCPLVPGFS